MMGKVGRVEYFTDPGKCGVMTFTIGSREALPTAPPKGDKA